MLSNQGLPIASFGQGLLAYPAAVSCHATSSFIVAMNLCKQGHIFDANNLKRVRTFGNLSLTAVSGVTYHSTRRQILMAETSTKQVAIWSEDGSQHINNVSTSNSAQCICVDPNNSNRIFVGVFSTGICVYDIRNNQRMQVIGSRGDGSQQVEPRVHGICMNESGTLMATDCHGDRVRVWKYV